MGHTAEPSPVFRVASCRRQWASPITVAGPRGTFTRFPILSASAEHLTRAAGSVSAQPPVRTVSVPIQRGQAGGWLGRTGAAGRKSGQVASGEIPGSRDLVCTQRSRAYKSLCENPTRMPKTTTHWTTMRGGHGTLCPCASWRGLGWVRSAGLVVFQTRGFFCRWLHPRKNRRSQNVAEPCATP